MLPLLVEYWNDRTLVAVVLCGIHVSYATALLTNSTFVIAMAMLHSEIRTKYEVCCGCSPYSNSVVSSRNRIVTVVFGVYTTIL